MNARRHLVEAFRPLRAVLRNADVRKLELAWASSNLAERASALAVAIYAYESNGVRGVGVVAFVRLGLGAAVSPWLAALADRRPRRAVLLGSDLTRALLLAAMAGLVPVEGARPAVYVLAVLVVFPESLFRSAQVAHLPSLVAEPGELVAANTVASAVESIGLFAGPALGGLLVAVSDVRTVFLVSAALAFASAALVSRISVAGTPEPEERRGLARMLLGGWRAIMTEPGLRLVIGLFSVQTFVAGLFNVLILVLAVDLLDLDVSAVGWLDGMVGVGAAAGVLAVAGAAGGRRLVRHFAAGLLLWGVPLAVIAAQPSLAAAIVLLVLVGVGNTLVDVTGVTLMQRIAADDVLGRVFGAFEALVLLTMALGSLLAPVLVSTLGSRGAFAVAGAIVPVALLVLWRPLSSLEAAPPPEHIDLLEGVRIFAPLPAPQLERLAFALVEQRVDAGTTIIRQGDPGDLFYVVAEGRAAVSEDGWQVGTVSERDGFGEIALLRDVPRTATVRALTPMRLYALDRDVFLATVNGDAASAEAAGSIVAARLPSPVIS
jgi:MFS family permease